jgi:hypothetical protein
LSHVDVYTLITHKSAKDRACSVVAIFAGTSSKKVIEVTSLNAATSQRIK